MIFSESLRPSVVPWYIEASRRFDRPVMVVGHGARVEGVWCVWPDDATGRPVLVPIPMYWVAWRVHRMYPNRTVVIIACNPDRDTLAAPGVYYALGYVCILPLRLDIDMVTRIEDFVAGDER